MEQRCLEDVHLVAPHRLGDVADAVGGPTTRSPRHASSHARVRSRVATEVATGLSPTVVGRGEGGRRRPALAEQQVALGDADVRPHQRRVLPGRAAPRRRRPGTAGSPPRPRPVSRAISASAISNHTQAPIALVAARPFGGRLEQLRGPAA